MRPHKLGESFSSKNRNFERFKIDSKQSRYNILVQSEPLAVSVRRRNRIRNDAIKRIFCHKKLTSLF